MTYATQGGDPWNRMFWGLRNVCMHKKAPAFLAFCNENRSDFSGISCDFVEFRWFSQENCAFSRIIKEICKNQGQEGIFRAMLLDFNDVLRQNENRRSTQNGRKVYSVKFQQNSPNRLREMCVFSPFLLFFTNLNTIFGAPKTRCLYRRRPGRGWDTIAATNPT